MVTFYFSSTTNLQLGETLYKNVNMLLLIRIAASIKHLTDKFCLKHSLFNDCKMMIFYTPQSLYIYQLARTVSNNSIHPHLSIYLFIIKIN